MKAESPLDYSTKSENHKNTEIHNFPMVNSAKSEKYVNAEIDSMNYE